MLKRLFDIIASLSGILLLSPMLIGLGALVGTTSPGGVFFRQKRVGKDGREFYLYKFRTMRPDSDKKGLITVGDRDPRVTAVGYFLRKYKLDELPQLINVLKGEMSIVGPRPEVIKYVNLYSEEQKKVLNVRPGLTDYASLEYINESELLAKAEDPDRIYIEQIMPAKLDLNLKYIRERSIATDLNLIGKTILRILR